HQQCVAGVVELELVDAHQHRSAQQVHRSLEAQSADQVGVLDEGAVDAVAVGREEQGGQQVGLAHPVASVEVDPAGRVGSASQQGAQPAPWTAEALRDLGDRFLRLGL